MNIPTVKTMASHFGKDKAVQLRKAFKGYVDNGYRVVGLKEALDILDGYGIEYIQHKDMNIAYVNMGDSYATTILRVNGKIRVGDWGSIIER